MPGMMRAAQFADDAFVADAESRAKFATDFFDEATVNDLFATGAIDTDRMKASADIVLRDGSIPFTGTVGGVDGVAATDLATKGQVDAAISGLDPKESCCAGTTQPLLNDSTDPVYTPLGGTGARGQINFTAGPSAIDGHSCVDTDRILVKNEQDGTDQVSTVTAEADSSGSLNSTYWVIYATPNLAYYVWYDVNSAGVDPAPTAPAGVTYVGVKVDVATDAANTVVAAATETELDALLMGGTTEAGVAPFDVVLSTATLTITNTYGGLCTAVADGDTGWATFTNTTPGTGLGVAANGIWVRTSVNQWDRAEDFDTDPEVTTGAYSFVVNGTANHDIGFILTSHDPVVIGGAAGDPIIWATFTSVALGGTPSTINPDDAADEGTSGSAARSDHQHAIAGEAPSVTVKSEQTAAAEGSGEFMRSGAQIQAATAAPSANITGDTSNGQGAASTLARSDHGHALTTATAVGIDGDSTSIEGDSAGMARANHKHAITTATAVGLDKDSTSAEGDSAGMARANHTHAVTFPVPTKLDKGRLATATVGADGQTTGLAITVTPTQDGMVEIRVNGISYELGDGVKTKVCYFSGDAGANARAIADIIATDVLYWNGTSYFQLTATDVVDMDYLV